MLLRVLVVCLALCVLTSVVESATNKPRIARERLLPNGQKVPVEVHQEEEDFLVNWIKDQQHKNPELSDVFKEHVPEHVNSLETMGDYIHKTPGLLQNEAAADAFKKQFGFDVDPACTDDKLKYWYRQYDGSCNWMRKGESQLGATNWPRMRDFDQTTYADGYNSPREGPNARDVSNKFFQRKKKFEYNHSAVLLALIEFVMHDVTYSENNYTDLISVPMPADEAMFPNTTVLKVPRTVKQDGTGVSGKPRENPNKATTWLDASSLYGSTTEYATSLRANKTGKLRSQMRPDGEYLPFNDFGLQMNAKPKQAQSDLFAGGDARTNEDWLLLGIHTLLLREHNRLCDILSKQRPDMDDEQLYQTVKLLVSSKFALIANTYQMTYWTNQMAWPRDDGFPLYRAMLGKGLDEVNPYHTYPWEYVTRPNGQPQIASQEMAMVYRFHEFIIGQLPLVDANNKTYAVKELIETGFDAKGFMETGIDNVLRGMVTSTIPNFKSGVDETFRSAGAPGSGVYRGFPFDIVVASIVHEREQGLPTFNQYFRKFNTKVPEPATKVPIREKFEDFSSDPEAVANLKKLYKTPDDVDLVVGTQLDEAMFPGTTVPLSALIVSLFSLFGLGNSDRFSPGYAITRCLLIDTPHNCRVTNALEDLIWKPTGDQPNHRWIDSFWVQEMDFAAHGQNLLWRLITENSNVKCLQYNPLFPVDHETNPILCAIPKEYDWKYLISNFIEIFVTFAAMGLLWAKHHPFKAALILTAVVIVIVLIVKFFKWICCGKKQKQAPQAKRKSVKKVTKQA